MRPLCPLVRFEASRLAGRSNFSYKDLLVPIMQRIWYPFKLAVDPRWGWTWIWLLSLSLQGQEGTRMEWDQLPALPNVVVCRRALCRHASGCPDRCGEPTFNPRFGNRGKSGMIKFMF